MFRNPVNFLVVFLGLSVSTTKDPFGDQPRLSVENGHLILRAAKNKNVTLLSTGEGGIRVNDFDLSAIVQTSRNLQSGSSSQGISLQRLSTDLQELQNQWNSVENIGVQVDQLESNVTIIARRLNRFLGRGPRSAAPFRTFVRKLSRLDDQLRELTRLLTTNECLSNPCANGGTCIDSYNAYTCQCPDNWEGPTCERDVNECSRYYGTNLGCQNGATCQNTPGSYRCECQPNWYGIHCTENHDDCTGASHQELCGHGTCINENRVVAGQPKYRCLCEEGWTRGTGSPACDVDIDECSQSNIACSRNPPVSCINLPGTFHCGPCPSGYTGNGQVCHDINECVMSNGGCSRNPYVECINTIGSRSCGPCPTGYVGDGVVCSFFGGCSVNRGGCHLLARCIDNPNAPGSQPVCVCPPGYVGNGEGPTGCMVQSQTMTCSNNPCVHGTCQANGDSFQCTCFAGYTGTLCDQTVDACYSQPCQNGGTCIRQGLSYSCTCTEEFEGPMCADAKHVCGGNLYSDNGRLQYPENPNEEYRHSQNCVWVIFGTMGMVFNITIERLHVENSVDCAYDYLQLQDGYASSSPLIGRYCGFHDDYGLSVVMSHNFAYIHFHSDSSVAGLGFTLSWNITAPVCGEDLNVTEYGAINSPGYPNHYPPLRDCYWIVRVRTGKRIRFQFATLQLEQHANCSFDYLKIYDGASENDPELVRHCTTVTPPPVTSSSSTVLVHFHSDRYVEDTGFHITYAAVPGIHGCGGLLTNPSGTFSSPNYPDTYDNHLSCEWLIRIHPGNRIQLTFVDFELEAHRDCRFDTVEIYDGSSDAAELLSRHCGGEQPADITSNGHQLFVKFRTDSSVQRSGFKARYKTICGGFFSELQGSFHSPYYPDNYPDRATCLYHIILPRGNIVRLHFPELQLEATSECRFDYVEVKDGNTDESPIIGRYCAISTDVDVTSTYNEMLVKFVSDGSVTNRGFFANYTNIDVGCGGVMTSDNGYVNTPMHPSYYPPSIVCAWQIKAPVGFVIRLTFQSFVLETHANCEFDYVFVNDSTGSSMGQYCGVSMPPILTTSGNIMWVTFVSDYSNNQEGFNATYTFLDASRTCGGDYHAEEGVVRSPGFPQPYPHGIKCVWILHAANGHQIELNVSSFSLETHADCKYDYLEIRNGGQATSPLHGKYCGANIPKDIISHSNVLRLEFQTDISQTAPGFEIFYNTASTGCGGTLSTLRGSITSPNYPESYSHNSECQWLISVSPGSTIFLTIIAIDIEREMACEFDYLEIFNGNSENSPSFGRFCNELQSPAMLVTTGNTAFVRFRTDSSGSGTGFHLIYQANCVTELKGRRGVIESPNFRNMYPHSHNCTWKINAPVGNNISLAFSHLFLEDSTSCNADYVEVKELSENGQDKSLAKYCGTPFPLPAPIVTGTNNASVHFITDSSVSHDGFRLEWSVVGCGGELTKSYGIITTPNYPDVYPLQTECFWHIKLDEGKRIELRILDLDLEHSPNCIYDYLRVYAGESENSPRITNRCERITKPETLVSHGNQMVVHFRSDRSVAGKGFKAVYAQKSSGCGGTYTVREATIMSPSYPDVYNANDECDYLIRIDANHLIILEFYDFSLPTSVNCTNGYVAIYDGRNSSMPLLKKLCGGMPEQSIISSTGNEMLIRLKADGNNVGKGFKVHYKPGCGRRIIADQGGEITSPGYPSISFGFYNCSWIISASDPGEKVMFLITHVLMGNAEDCDTAGIFVEVRDGDQPDSPLIGRYCGTHTPPAITSRGNALHVYLHMHGIFRANYGIISSHCGGALMSYMGSFASPGYPENYQMDTECIWTIQASAGNLVQVTFQTFNIEQSEYCNVDYVEVREDDAGGHLIGRYCGDEVPSIVTAANRIWIKFQSDEFGTAPGFTAQYNLVHGIQLNASEGIIESPGYPNVHYSLQVGGYKWLIVAPMGKVISAEFEEIYIRPHTEDNSLCYTAVQLFDGAEDTAPLLGEYCGYSPPEPKVTHGNQMLVKFSNSGDTRNIGWLNGKWKLRWSTVDQWAVVFTDTPVVSESTCYHVVELNSSGSLEIISEGYPESYMPNVNCTWIIKTPPIHHVRIRVIDLQLEGYDMACYYDKVDLYTAPYSYSPSWELNTTLCGRIENTVYDAPNNILKMVFTTDSYGFMAGFRISAEAACGGALYGQSGVLDSQYILSDIHNELQQNPWVPFSCIWIIRVETRRTMQIYFDEFNIPSDQTCSSSHSHFLILNGGQSSSPMLGRGKYCGTSIPEVPETASDVAFVKLYVPSNINSLPQFKLHYRQISLSCGGHLYIDRSTPVVEMQSPNYPSPPSHPVECNWIIMSPSGTRMRIDLENEMHFTGDCWQSDNQEFLQFYDGGTDTAEPIRRYCNYDRPFTIWTTGNALYATYLTQVEHPGAGFKATIRTAACGGKYFSWYGTISSPNYPSNYSNGLDCHYVIQVRDGYSVTLTINKLDTPPSQNCTFTDYLEVREDGENGELIGIYCGSVQYQRVELAGNKVYLIFRSDSSSTGAGFSLLWGTEIGGCGATPEITSESGVLTSPGFPLALPTRKDCDWTISAPEGRSISLTFTHFNLPENPLTGSCLSSLIVSNISIYYMHDMVGRELCGSQLPGVIQSSSNRIHLSLKTYGLLAGQGFSLHFDTFKEAPCGALLSEPSGSIASPNFTFSNNSIVTCTWKVDSVGDNQTTVFQFETLDLSGDVATYCRTSRLFLYTASPNALGRTYCGNFTNKRPVFTNPHKETTIGFFANMSVPYNGFRATYHTNDCGGIIQNTDTVITSPNYPANYSTNLYCHWLIRVPYGEKLKLSFLDLRMEEDCKKDYLLVLNGIHAQSPVLGKFCGTNLPQAIESDTSVMTLIFHTNEYGSAPGFKVTLAEVEQGCGGLTHLSHGIITSPNYPSKYDSNVECVWEIEATSGSLINVSFVERFDLEADSSCSKDYILIENLEDHAWVEKQKSCGLDKPQPFISISPKVRLTFHSNGQIQGDGFKVQHTSVCGGTFADDEGVIFSPEYPQEYRNDQHCQYFVGQPGHYLTLTFDPDQFSIEASTDDICRYDYVTIYRGNTTSSDVIGTYCGAVAPSPLMVYGQILVEFATDSSVTAHGFVLKYRQLGCGGFRNDDFGIIVSPVNVDDNYMNYMDCTWEIHTPDNTAISLKFNIFELEPASSCGFDFVNVFDGNITTGTRIGKLCGNKLPPILQSTSNHMTIRFVTDGSVVHQGFRAVYRKTYGPLQGCGGTIIAASGEFFSSDIDNDGLYESDLDCMWKIIGTSEQILNITFSQFNLELENTSCRYDYVEIRDGVNLQDPIIRRYCGSSLPSPIVTTGNMAVIIFHTDTAVNKPGFRATFTSVPSVCGASTLFATDNAQVLTSPNFPDAYPPNVFCRWNFFTNFSYENEISLSFENLAVPCTREYLEIHENKRIDSKTYRLCGETFPKNIVVLAGAWISLHTDTSGPGHKFKLLYKTAGCNRNYTETNGIITNHNYPHYFSFYGQCIMHIAAPIGSTISLYFGLDFKLYPEYDCEHYSLKAYDGEDVSAPLLATMCGLMSPNPIFSTGNMLTLELLANSGFFYISYTTTTQGRGCGGALNMVNGTFSSPLYPMPYNRSSECKWELSVPGHHTLTLVFDFFSLNSSSGCSTNYIEIFEGLQDVAERRVNRLCGTDRVAPYISQGSQVLVKLVTDTTNSAPGFLARFSMNSLYEYESTNVIRAPTSEEAEHLQNGETVYLIT